MIENQQDTRLLSSRRYTHLFIYDYSAYFSFK